MAEFDFRVKVETLDSLEHDVFVHVENYPYALGGFEISLVSEAVQKDLKLLTLVFNYARDVGDLSFQNDFLRQKNEVLLYQLNRKVKNRKEV